MSFMMYTEEQMEMRRAFFRLKDRIISSIGRNGVVSKISGIYPLYDELSVVAYVFWVDVSSEDGSGDREWEFPLTWTGMFRACLVLKFLNS